MGDTYYDSITADTVIFDLMKKISKLQGIINSLCAEHSKDEGNLYAKEQYQKYKRCLSMAKWCKAECKAIRDGVIRTYTYPYFQTCPAELNPKYEFYHRWHLKWMSMANQLKEVVE